eukprot:jgi/Botrbrau1/1548/Bobra.0107s0036.1
MDAMPILAEKSWLRQRRLTLRLQCSVHRVNGILVANDRCSLSIGLIDFPTHRHMATVYSAKEVEALNSLNAEESIAIASWAALASLISPLRTIRKLSVF